MSAETILILFGLILGASGVILGQLVAHCQEMRKMKRESWARIQAIKATEDSPPPTLTRRETERPKHKRQPAHEHSNRQ